MSDVYKDIDRMGEVADNQYLLTMAIARRVRKLRAGAPSLVDSENARKKPFKTAMKELAEHKIQYLIKENS